MLEICCRLEGRGKIIYLKWQVQGFVTDMTVFAFALLPSSMSLTHPENF
jgi:hypothetical protein